MQEKWEEQRTELFYSLNCFSEKVCDIYERAISDYHIHNSTDSQRENPFTILQVEHLFYSKCWVDTVQWHIEDEIRNPEIGLGHALKLKRRIDALNQDRTNMVELIDNHILIKYQEVAHMPNARINSESPAWALDRLSILALKIYHMDYEAKRSGASQEHREGCARKLEILLDQRHDLSVSVNELLCDISSGHKCMKVYKQMKMYNDPNLNPILYHSSEV